MTGTPDTGRTAHAWQNREHLPGEASGIDRMPPVSPVFEAGGEDSARAARRESFMVGRERPEPELRPGPVLAMDADREAFTANWERERREAAAHEEAQRRERFMAARAAPEPEQQQDRRAGFNARGRE